MDDLSPTELIRTIAQNTDYKKKAEDFIDLVANGLNSSSSHFLLELIQNADDNDYDDPYPALTVMYTANGHLRLHCNEKGFQNEHVAAICNINRSTKRESSTTTGEKGIGFKSVFRVARSVWIASGDHRFKLHREKPFEPEIFELPFPDRSGADSKGTYMYFEIAKEKTCDVRESLERFQPANILFLKKLEQAIISIKDHSKRKMCRINKPMDNGPSRVTIIEDGGPQLHYIQFSFAVKLTVPRPPRRDNKETCIKFAFPVTEDFQQLMLRNEKVYAYLPVKDCGFKFAFHADFVLVASREDIEDSEWNRQLRGAIAEKFAETIEQLNESDTSIRYTWPLLLTSPSNLGDFFYNLMTDIKEELKSRPVLETQAGDLVSPKEAGLVRFPARWRLGRDKEIPIPSTDESVKYLSDKYDVDCTWIIGLIGVKEISDLSFWSGLKSFIGKDGFLRQSEDWHNKLAEMLNNDQEFRKYCDDLDLIPVESGMTSWVCSRGNQSNLFIATRDYGVDSLPQGIGLHIIPENATRNKERLELFKAYGAKYASEEIVSIAIKIREKHLNFDPKSSDLTTEQLISHISFLFRHKSEKPLLDKVWVATESGVPKLASETFAKPLEFSGHQLEVPVLHGDYWAGLSMEEAKDLSTWMNVTFKMPELPRLATSDESPMSLSPEMRFIAQECDSFDFLDLLRQHWELSPQLLKKGDGSFQENLWNDIVSIEIRYQDSKSSPLSDTILPSEDTEKFQTNVPLPLLPIPKDNSADWGFLTNFGVKISLDVQHWLRCLTNMKSSSSANMEPSAEATREKPDDLSYLVSYVYSKIWDACTKNSDIQRQVREKFQAQDLIFIPFQPSSSLRPELIWARPEQCIWFGPQELELKHTFTLARYTAYYPRRDFFLNVLQIKESVDLSRLEYEAKQLSASADSLDTPHGLDYIGRLFREMSWHVRVPSDEDKEYDALKRCPMLPIRFRNSARHIDQLIAATDDAEWFVADRELFLESFRTQVSLLALDIYQIRQCDRLFSFLNLDRRYLSQITVSYSMTGKADNAVYAAKWMKKAKYIDRLASKPIHQPILCPVPLRKANIEAFGSSPDSVELIAQGRHDKYYGTVKHRLAVAHLSGNVFSIYVSNDNLSSSRTLMELADDICDIYHIPAARRLLVPYIIDQEDMDEVENILENKKIPKLRNHRPKKSIKNESTVSAPVSRNEKTEGQTAAAQLDLEKKAPKISEEDSKDGPARSVQVPKGASGQTNDLMMSSLPSPPSSSSGTVGHSPAPSINAQELGGEPLSEKANQRSPSPREVGSKPDTADGPHEKRTDGDTENRDRQQSSHVSHIWADKAGKATAGTIPPQTAVRTSPANETDKSTMISEGRVELPNRNATLIPRRQVSRSPSRTPLTGYIEFENHKAPYSPPSSTYSRTRSNKDNFVNFGKGWMTIPPPMTIFYGNDTNDTEYFGELYVSAYLENFLGKGVYKPKEHWTSPLRSRNALPSYTPKCSDTSTFTIKTRAKLRDAIICSGQVPSNALADCITVHIEVCTTNGDLNSYFFLRNCQYKKIEAYHLRDKKKNEHVYILARVYQIWENPGIAMYVDPWQLQLDASITLEATSSYLGHIVQSTPTVLAEKFASVSRVDETSNIYDGLEVGPGKIRLLKLQHVEDDSEPLTGWLEVVEVDQLDELEDFWAISYHWGPMPVGPNPPTFTRKDGTMPATIQITESLSSCLKCLRRKGVNARIWADALCINQKDAKEKSIQVRRLGSLYDKAARVIVWLGHNGGMDETSREIEWLTEVHQSLCLPNGCCHTHQGPPATNPNAPDKNDPHWNEVSEFLKRPWFTRSWVIQELVLGGDVSIMSGRSEMKWDCFMESLLECGRHLNRGLDGDAKDGSLFLESSAAAIALHRTRQVYRHSKQKFHFLRLLEMFAYTDSSRARDKMFSLLNLAVDLYLSEEDFDPDYASTDEMVMKKYARGLVRNDHALDLLYHAGHDKSTSFCSWIPDFVGLRLGPPSSTKTRRTYPPTISTWKTRGGGGRFYAGLHGLSWAEVLDNSQGAAIHPAPILKMKGYVVDEIHECSELGLGRSDVVTFAKALYNMRRYVSYLEEYPEIDDKDASVDDHAGLGAGLGWQDKLLLRLLVGDSKGPQTGSSWTTQFSHSNADDDEEQVRPWPAETGPEILSLNLDKDARILEEKPVEAQMRMAQYWQTAWTFASRIPGAAFCTTRNPRARNPRARDRRYAGIVPGGAVSGDLIFVANGGRVPFVLRQVERTDYYTLIGECYIHGIMYGLPPSVQDKADLKVRII